VLLRHDALIDKLIGDEMMALFIPGICGPDCRRRAIAAALDVMRSVGYGTHEGAWLALGAAVNAGPAYVGNVGAAGITDFTALGDTSTSRRDCRPSPRRARWSWPPTCTRSCRGCSPARGRRPAWCAAARRRWTRW
jgi:hypothetical protein